MGQISGLAQMAYIHRMREDEKGYRRSIEYAVRVYRAHQQDATAPTAADVRSDHGDEVAYLLARPRAVGTTLSLLDRVSLYRTLDDKTRRQVYDMVSADLRHQCQAKASASRTPSPNRPAWTSTASSNGRSRAGSR